MAAVGVLSIPLIVKLTYEPDACRAYSQAEVSDFVRQNLEPGRSICSVKSPVEWTNQFSPYELIICDSSDKPVGRAEVYPDCGLEWRAP